MDNAEHRGDDPERGHAVRHRLHRVGDDVLLLVMGLDAGIHQGLHLMRIVGAHDQHPEKVAKEFKRMMVF